MHRLNDFILGIPYLFLMKVPYLWLPAVVFFTWPPLVSMLLAAIILIGLLAMNWQDSAWIDKVTRDFATNPRSISIEKVLPPAGFVIRNSLLLMVLSVAIGWLLNGVFGLTGIQWALFSFGFIALYKKGFYFGYRVTYIFCDQGCSIRFVPGHLDYRLLVRFDEIRSVQKTGLLDSIPNGWTVISPIRDVKEGLLLTPRNSNGFSTQLGPILLTSSDLEGLLHKFPTALTHSA